MPARHLGLVPQSRVKCLPGLHFTMPCPAPCPSVQNQVAQAVGAQPSLRPPLKIRASMLHTAAAQHDHCPVRTKSVVSHLRCLLLLRLLCPALGRLLASACTRSTHASDRWHMSTRTCGCMAQRVSSLRPGAQDTGSRWDSCAHLGGPVACCCIWCLRVSLVMRAAAVRFVASKRAACRQLAGL